MTGAVDLANEAWTENTALTEEAGKRYETTESKLAMASNAFDNLKVAIGDQLNPVLEKCAEGGAQAFTWAADFIDKNSWVVGALTSVTTAVGLLAVGVAGYNIATTIAIPATEAFTAALLANPVGQVAVALVAVTAAVTGVAIAMANSEPPADKYKEAIITPAKLGRPRGIAGNPKRYHCEQRVQHRPSARVYQGVTAAWGGGA